jgi:hypothetical protein
MTGWCSTQALEGFACFARVWCRVLRSWFLLLRLAAALAHLGRGRDPRAPAAISGSRAGFLGLFMGFYRSRVFPQTLHTTGLSLSWLGRVVSSALILTSGTVYSSALVNSSVSAPLFAWCSALTSVSLIQPFDHLVRRNCPSSWFFKLRFSAMN